MNNKINGQGKEYNWNGELLFEGEYLNGKIHGKIKEYDFSYEYKKYLIININYYLNVNI